MSINCAITQKSFIIYSISATRREIYYSYRIHFSHFLSDRRRVCVTLTWNPFLSLSVFTQLTLPQKTARLNTTYRTYCPAAESQPFPVAGRRGGPPDPRVSPASSAAGPRSRDIPGGPRTRICCPRVFPPAGPPRPPLAPSCKSETKTMSIRATDVEDILSKRRLLCAIRRAWN